MLFLQSEKKTLFLNKIFSWGIIYILKNAENLTVQFVKLKQL